jgi:transposase
MGRVEIFQGRARRRWSEDDKRRLVAETLAPGETVHGVARRRGVSTSQLFTWRKRLRAEAGFPPPPPGVPGFAAVAIAPVPPLAGDAAEASPGLIEVELACGDRVRITGPADPAVVAAALRALAGR